MKRSTIKAKDGKIVSVVEWTDVEEPVGIIQISHGMAEHAMRYDRFAQNMNKSGFLVIADDHRAHGKTDEDTHGFSSGDIWEKTLSDMKEVMDYFRDKYKKEYGREFGVVLFGHSYGSFLAQAYVRRHAKELSGAVIGGSNYFAGATVGAGRLISKLALTFKKGARPAKLLAKMSFDAYNKKFDTGTFISSIPEECDTYIKDPDCGFVCSNCFYYYMFGGAKTLYKKCDTLKDFPVLLVSGSRDPVGNMGRGVKKLCSWYLKKGAKARYILYDGVRHEYLNDVSRIEATKDIGEFCHSVIRTPVKSS